MRLFKFLITQDAPIIVDGILHDQLMSFVLAESSEAAKDELRKLCALLYSDPIEYAWLDFVSPQEIDVGDGPRVVGYAKFG